MKKDDHSLTATSNMTPLLGKNLLVVNTGGLKKRFIFQRLKKLGVKIICLNRELNWAKTYVDQWILADTYNHSESIASIKEFLQEHPDIIIDGAITFWEDDIPLLAKIVAELHLRGNSLEAATNTRDKYRIQDRFRQCGLSYIKQVLLRSKADLGGAFEKIGFPAVIKPVMGANSEFVVLVNTKEEAVEAYDYVLKNCTPKYDPIYTFNKGLFVYQEYISGHEFSLECFCQHGVPQVVGIHEKTAMDHPFFMETGDYVPPRIADDQKNQLIKAVESALIVLGLENSLAHVEIKLTKSGPTVIDVASRMGGDYTYEAVTGVYDFDLIKSGVEIAMGININQKPVTPQTFMMGRYFMSKTSGVVTTISGIDEIEKMTGVVDLFLFKKVGDSVLVPPDGYEALGWVLVKGESYGEVERIMGSVFEMAEIEVVPFKSYSSVGKTVRKSRFSSALISKGIQSNKIEKLRRVLRKNQRRLHVGIACNIFDKESGSEVEKDLMSVGTNIEKTLLARGYKVTFFDFNNLVNAFAELSQSDVDLVFNVCERINDSSLLEPHAASILDVLQLPYTGSNPFTLALCIDKIRVKKLLSYHNIPTPKWDYAYDMDDDIRDDLQYPLILKPGNTDNSIGITNESVVTNKKEFERQMEYIIRELKRPALVEEFIEGDEYDVAILGSEYDDFRVLPLSRSLFDEMPSGLWHIYPFDAKWKDSQAYDKIQVQRPPKNVSKRLQSLISEIALDTYNILDCHDYGRVEMRVDRDGNPYVLELNPNPSINIGDAVPKCAILVGMDYGDFIEEIIRLAIKRYRDRPPYYHLQASLI